MKKLLVLGSLLLATLAMSSQATFANAPRLNGTWQFNLYADPDKTPSGHVCMVFVVTNDIEGVTKYSGTWKELGADPNFGQWIQQGNNVLMWGINPYPIKTALFFTGNMQTKTQMGGLNYAALVQKTGKVVSTGTFSATRNSRCNPAT